MRADLRGLSKQGAEFVAGHLAAAGELAESDPEQAWEHARAARSQGGRVAVVRETVGLVAYRAAKWSEALSELRAARRMAGGPGQLAVMADCERALGNPERAIELSKTPEAGLLDPETSAELAIVVAGARSDLGQHAAARAALHAAARGVDASAPYAFRVYYAYAAKLADEGETTEAVDWFVKAADADEDDETDAAHQAELVASGRWGEDDDEEDRDEVGGEDDGADEFDGLDGDADDVDNDDADLDGDADDFDNEDDDDASADDEEDFGDEDDDHAFDDDEEAIDDEEDDGVDDSDVEEAGVAEAADGTASPVGGESDASGDATAADGRGAEDDITADDADPRETS